MKIRDQFNHAARHLLRQAIARRWATVLKRCERRPRHQPRQGRGRPKARRAHSAAKLKPTMQAEAEAEWARRRRSGGGRGRRAEGGGGRVWCNGGGLPKNAPIQFWCVGGVVRRACGVCGVVRWRDDQALSHLRIHRRVDWPEVVRRRHRRTYGGQRKIGPMLEGCTSLSRQGEVHVREAEGRGVERRRR